MVVEVVDVAIVGLSWIFLNFLNLCALVEEFIKASSRRHRRHRRRCRRRRRREAGASKALIYHLALREKVKSPTYSLLVGRLPLSLHLDRVGRAGGRVLVSYSRLVREEHGRGPEHVAERVVEQIEDGGRVQVGVPVEKRPFRIAKATFKCANAYCSIANKWRLL